MGDSHGNVTIIRFTRWLVLISLLVSASAEHDSCSNSTKRCAKNNGDDNILVVEVEGSAIVATTDDAFICATLDWWPPDKCDYGSCSWGQASILNLDLANPLLEKSLRALQPLRIRLGGTLQDHIVYDIGLSPSQPCLPIVKDATSMFGFREGCLTMDRWIALNTLFATTGSLVVFGLNALIDRTQVGGVWSPWNSTNARNFIKFTIDKEIQVDAWELGNELTANGIGTSIPAEQYARDVSELRSIINSLYEGFTRRPLVVAPDGFFNPEWFTRFLTAAGPGIVDAVTRHVYNLGPGNSNDLVEKVLNPTYLDNELSHFRAVQDILQASATSASAWVGEAGGAYNSGHHLVTDAFVFSFWYLDQLGMAASFNNKAYCRQSLIGGNYGLLNTASYKPNPDMYSAILWKRLMGTRVLRTTLKDYPQLRTYAHCQRGSMGGVTMVLINLSNSTVNVIANLVTYPKNEPLSHGETKSRHPLIPKTSKGSRPVMVRFEYHLSAPQQDLHSQTTSLNGVPLELNSSGDLPTMDPVVKKNSSPVSIAPLSIVFVVLSDAKVSVCSTERR